MQVSHLFHWSGFISMYISDYFSTITEQCRKAIQWLNYHPDTAQKKRFVSIASVGSITIRCSGSEFVPLPRIVGTLRNYDGEGNGNVKKQ